MKIIITGATGFIGKRLISKIDKKDKIIAFVRRNSEVSLLKNIGAQIRYGDLLDKESVLDSIKNADTVIHLATSHLAGNEEGNIIGTKNLIDACKKNKISKIIFISSMATKRKRIDEYGKAKLKIEEMIKSCGLTYVILRPSIIYSENNLSLIGRSLRIPLIIPIIGSGNYKINPVQVDDVAKAIIAAIKSKKAVNKEYDVAGAENISFNEVIRICKDKFRIRKLILHIPMHLAAFIFRFIPIASREATLGIEENTNADITGLKEDLNIHPTNFKEGVKNVII